VDSLLFLLQDRRVMQRLAWRRRNAPTIADAGHPAGTGSVPRRDRWLLPRP